MRSVEKIDSSHLLTLLVQTLLVEIDGVDPDDSRIPLMRRYCTAVPRLEATLRLWPETVIPASRGVGERQFSVVATALRPINLILMRRGK